MAYSFILLLTDIEPVANPVVDGIEQGSNKAPKTDSPQNISEVREDHFCK